MSKVNRFFRGQKQAINPSIPKLIWLPFLLILGLGIITLLGWIEPTPKTIKSSAMEVICYCCGRGENPENTLEGIQHCQTINADWRIEMDVQLTADEELVLLHDYNTKRTTGQDQFIYDLSLAEAKQLNAGYHFKVGDDFPYRSAAVKIPTLKEVFTNFPEANLLLDVHTDNPKVVPILIDLIETEFTQGNFIIASEYDAIIHTMKRQRPSWRYGVPAGAAKKLLYSSFLYLDNLFPIQSDILMLPKKYGKINVLSKRVINHAKKRNKQIWAWLYEGEYVKTVNSKVEMEELGAMGIEGIYTDYPEKLLEELQ